MSEFIKGTTVIGIQELASEREIAANIFMLPEEPLLPPEPMYTSSLAGFILQAFQRNKDARRNSLVEEQMLNSLRAYNGEYNPEDLAKIRASGGSTIFMNITSVKSRNAASWIRDILLPSKEKSWSVEPTPIPDLPNDIKGRIEESLQKQFQEYLQDPTANPISASPQQNAQAGTPAKVNGSQNQIIQAPSQPTNPVQQPTQASPAADPSSLAGPTPASPQVWQQPPNSPAQKPIEAAQTMKEFNQAKRDIYDMVLEEMNKIAMHEMKSQEYRIEDQLAEGGWHKALSEFIDNFVVFPTAFLKGPIITKVPTRSYENGKPVVKMKYVFKNKCISPLDMYPSANATSILDASNIVEHVRYTRREISDMRGMPWYKDAAIDAVLSEFSGATWLDTGIESERADAEKRGDEWQANQDIIHGLHFHGSIPAKELREWGVPSHKLDSAFDTDEFEVEGIVAGNHVIKCKINNDGMNLRPYYKASFQQIPGAFWGTSLPELMSDIQRMCNGIARAMSSNIGLASGPQIEIYVDRIADNGDIADIRPFKIWQLTSDPTGGGGRAITFNQPTSNAAELMGVYKEFESRADDVTGIPRYAYGNERMSGAATSIAGLSMLMESASKSIKDCVRNIDTGVIIPRIEYQFYWNIATDPSSNYTGDPNVVARGSSSLTTKGAEQLRRTEFLMATANPIDQEILGMDGRAELLRSVSEDLNMGEDVVPSRLELRTREKANAEVAAQSQQQALQLEQEKINSGLKATQLQIEGQKDMHKGTQAVKMQGMAMQQQQFQTTAQLKAAEMERNNMGQAEKNQADLMKTQYTEQGKDQRHRSEIALKIQSGSGI